MKENINWGKIFAILLLIFTFTWAGYQYFKYIPSGVAGTDPYCYVQMAIDIADTGLPVHRFALFDEMKSLNIYPAFTAPVGYIHVATSIGNVAKSDWPFGLSMIMAAGYLMIGEKAFFLITPIFSIISFIALIFLVFELFRYKNLNEKLLISSIAVFLLVITQTQIKISSMIASDAPANFFVILFFLFSLKAIRNDKLYHFILAGVSISFAYLMRHIAIIAVVPIFLLLLKEHNFKRTFVKFTIGGLVALILVVPDLLYHYFLFGNFLTQENNVGSFGLSFVPASLSALYQYAFIFDFGALILFMLLAMVFYSKNRQPVFLLLTWVFICFLFLLPLNLTQIFEHGNPSRYMFPAYFAICILIALSITEIIRYLKVKNKYLCAIFIIAVCLLIFFKGNFNSEDNLDRVIRGTFISPGYLYGMLNEEQVADFIHLKNITQNNSVILVKDDIGGPVALYSERAILRADHQNETEIETFVHNISESRKIYALKSEETLFFDRMAKSDKYEMILVENMLIGELYEIKIK